MKNNFDFSDYIRRIQEQPFVDNISQLLHATFLSYQAGISDNDPKILQKSFFLINQVHEEYISKKINVEELKLIYNAYINGKLNIDLEVPDIVLQNTLTSQLYDTSIILNKQQISNVQSQTENHNQVKVQINSKIELNQDIASKQNISGNLMQDEKKDQFIEQIQKSNVQMQEKNGNREIIDSNIQNDQQQVDISIPKIKDIYYLSIEQSQINKKQQYQEYRKQENQKSQIFLQQNQNSQIQQSVQCSICLENVIQNKYSLIACQHIYHKNCLENLINASDEFPIRCPNLECRQEILRDDLEKIVSNKIMDQLEKLAFNQYLIQSSNIFQCPTQNCKGVYEIEGPIQVCMICQNLFCTRCKKQFHEGVCGEQSFINVAQEKNYKQCSKCKSWIEKTFGCNHISCPCGFQFCYSCGDQWVKGRECLCNNRQQQNNFNAQQLPNDFNEIQTFLNQNQQNQNNTKKIDQVLHKLGLSFIKKIFRKL